jgi:hypothetical protein
VVADPDQIQPAAPRPDDFDAFWESKLEELAKVPANPKLEPVESGQPGVSYWTITMDNIRGSHIEGQIARPASGEKFPALLLPQYAGVYGLQKPWVTNYAAQGCLAPDIEPHDIPIDKPEPFYKERPAHLMIENAEDFEPQVSQVLDGPTASPSALSASLRWALHYESAPT